MKNKHIAQQSQWERCAPPLVWILPRGPVTGRSRWRRPRHRPNMHFCCLVPFIIWECKSVCVPVFIFYFFLSGEEEKRRRRRNLCSRGRKEKKKDEMDEGSLGALGVLIIRRSVAGSELTIFPWLYPCLMIWAVPLSLSLQLLWPNKEKREGKEGLLQLWLCHIYH